MYQCKSGKHWWTDEADAAKCCNGWHRVLVMDGGENQQNCAGVMVGRKWVLDSEDELFLRAACEDASIGEQLLIVATALRDGRRREVDALAQMQPGTPEWSAMIAQLANDSSQLTTQ